NFLENISVFLNPYMSFWDYGGSKFKLLEAAAAGIPVISTTNGAIGFPDKDALFIGDNIDEITTHINQLKNKELRISKGTFLRNIIIEKHDYINEAKKLIEIYNEVLD
ncbi:glycosyl transferase group 1 protein, partial [Candidatus Magnetomorum sp. HK-1]